MPTDTVVEAPSIRVMYVAGDRHESIPVQAPRELHQLETSLPSLRGRKFYGVVSDGEYKACATIRPDHDMSSLPHPTFTIPGGLYVHRRLPDWGHQTGVIGQIVEELFARPDHDSSRPVIEFYRSHRELVIRVPVSSHLSDHRGAGESGCRDISRTRKIQQRDDPARTDPGDGGHRGV